MIILAVGLNHKTAPVEVRERLAFPPEALSPGLAALKAYVAEGVILSTCNRTEVYGLVGHAPTGAANIRRFLADFHRVPLAEFEPYLYTLEHLAAVRHLFAVASGLDSMVLGEHQILGQVRQALEAARSAGTAGPVLDGLFRHAVHAGKRARTETEVGKSPVSVGSVAVALARQVLGSLTGRTVLVVGAGKMGEATFRALREAGADRLLVVNRTFSRAAALAAELGGQALAWRHLPVGLEAADIVVTSAGAVRPVIRPRLVSAVLGRRGGRPLVFIDIGVPRNVDPAVRALPGAVVYDIDDLEALCAANRRGREQEVGRVEAIIAEEVESFAEWWRGRQILPTILALRRRAEAIRDAELRRAFRRLAGLSESEQAVVRAMADAIINKLLHEPFARMKSSAEAGYYAEMVRRVFGLDEAGLADLAGDDPVVVEAGRADEN